MEGTPFGRYRLVELLGRGGMGDVWRAFDTVTERVVAVKVLPAHLADDRTFRQRFRREARAAADLDEPHVVPIYDFGDIEGRLFVTMRLIDGEDLQVVVSRGPLSPERAIRIIEQVASALHAAHRIGLVHRDVKPSNILVAEDDFAYLIDFGIARATGETGLTSTGMTVGTWAYMAPERFRSGVADARADVYALACVLYQALTGQLPFPGASLEQIAVAHMFAPPPQPSMVRDGVPVAMDHVIATGMAKEPDQRYATPKALAQAAWAALTTTTRQPRPEVRVDRAVDSRTEAGPTMSAFDAPTQQAPTQQAPVSPWDGRDAATGRPSAVAPMDRPQRNVEAASSGSRDRPATGGYRPAPPRRRFSWWQRALLWVAGVLGALALVIAMLIVINAKDNKERQNQQPPTSGLLPPPTKTASPQARVVVGGVDQYVGSAVSCVSAGGKVNIGIGADPNATGIGVVMSDGNPPQVSSVGVGTINGVPMGYADTSPSGSAVATKQGNSYTISGTATGVDTATGQSVGKPFLIDVTCPS